jgi:serine/threonine-protein kinase
MPLVEGESLRDRLRRGGPQPVADVLRWAEELTDALAYAHGHGIIHRDIKPENVLLSGQHALLADFGVARALETSADDRLTETGLALGTPAYMSPEQALADTTLDGRTDLYSLGCVLYELLTGEPPYTGPTARSIVAKRLSDPVPSARRLREMVPPALDDILQRLLAKSPADRFAGAAELGAALAGLPATTATVAPAPSPTQPPHPHTAVPPYRRTALLALVLLLAGAAVTF